VEIALSAICGPEDIVCPITPIEELKRLEVDAGARNYSEDRAAELRYLDCSKPLRRILTEFCIPALPITTICHCAGFIDCTAPPPRSTH
jgi:hypothetical protein